MQETLSKVHLNRRPMLNHQGDKSKWHPANAGEGGKVATHVKMNQWIVAHHKRAYISKMKQHLIMDQVCWHPLSYYSSVQSECAYPLAHMVTIKMTQTTKPQC